VISRGSTKRQHDDDLRCERTQCRTGYRRAVTTTDRDDHAPYQANRELLGFRRFFGPEQRDILMMWRNRLEVIFAKHHGREPGGVERVQTGLHCQHDGKSLSVDHWEETCDYYMQHFPFVTYGRKWSDRKGRPIHTQSDFMRPLYEWGDTLFANAVKI